MGALTNRESGVRGARAIAACSALWAASSAVTAQPLGIRTIALRGDVIEPIDRPPPLNQIRGFGEFGGYDVTVFVSDAGQVAFAARMFEESTLNTTETIIEDQGAFHLPFQRGDQALGLEAGVLYSSTAPVWLDDQGQLWWRALLEGEGVSADEQTLGFVSNESAIWIPDSNGSVRVVREGERVSNHPPNVRLQDPELVVSNGRPLIRSLVGDRLDPDVLEDLRNEQGWSVYRVRPASLAHVFTANDGIDDSPHGDIEDGFFFINGIDPQDRIYVSASGQPPLRFTPWVGGSAAAPLEGVSYEGLALPPQIVQAGRMVIDDLGVLALSATAVFDGMVSERGVWVREGDSSYQLLLRAGDELPSAGGPLVVRSAAPMVVAPDGLVVLAVRTEPGESLGLWSHHPEEGFRELVRDDGVYPWLPPDADALGSLRGISVGASGEILFSAELQGDTINNSNSAYKAIVDRFGFVHPLAREGSPFETRGGLVRNVDNLIAGFVNTERVNPSGQAAFWLPLQEVGEGLYLADARVLGRCHAADLAPPLGELDFDDVLAFLVAFSEGRRRADLTPPLGELNFDDILAFLGAFGACE